MQQDPHTPQELFELAALFRRSAGMCDQQETQEKLRLAALELEARARKIAQEKHAQGERTHGPFACVDFLI